MKTKTLLFSAAALLAVFSVNAANDDVTPSHFKFSEKEVGPYEFFQYSNGGSNPVQPYPEEKLVEGGFVVLAGGQVKNNDESVAGINKGCHIVETEYGRMLLVKGFGSDEMSELDAADKLEGFMSFNMYTDKTFPTDVPVRFEMVTKVVGNPVGADITVDIWNKNGVSENIPFASTKAYTSTCTKWMPVIGDLNTAGYNASTLPLRIKFNIPGYSNFAGRAYYFARIKFTAEPTTEIPNIPADGWDTPDGTSSSVTTLPSDDSGFVAWDKENIYLNEMELGSAVYIYSLNGSLVKTVLVSDSFMEVPMSSGFYLVRYADKTSKVVIR